MRVVTLLGFMLFLISCNSEYTEESLIEDIENNKYSSIVERFYKKRPVEKEQLKSTLEAYSNYLKNDFRRVSFYTSKNGNSTRLPFRRERLGYMYLDENDNVVASITYKFIELENGTKQINFIDFRHSQGHLQCVKFPTLFPIKCVDVAGYFPPDLDSLNSIYPKQIHGLTFYHSMQVNQSLVDAQLDTIEAVLVFNTGNLMIKNNLEKIVGRLRDSFDLSQFVFAEYNDFGEPNINMNYDENSFDEKFVNKLKTTLQASMQRHVYPHSRKRKYPFGAKAPPRISIGGIYSKARVIY